MPDNSWSSGVTIGNVTGGIRNSAIAGRDVVQTAAQSGEAQGLDLARVTAMLQEVQQQLNALRTTLPATAPTSDEARTITEADANIAAALERMRSSQTEEDLHDARGNLDKASCSLSTLLERATAIANQVGEFRGSIKPVVDALPSVIEKVGMAAQWAAGLLT